MRPVGLAVGDDLEARCARGIRLAHCEPRHCPPFPLPARLLELLGAAPVLVQECEGLDGPGVRGWLDEALREVPEARLVLILRGEPAPLWRQLLDLPGSLRNLVGSVLVEGEVDAASIQKVAAALTTHRGEGALPAGLVEVDRLVQALTDEDPVLERVANVVVERPRRTTTLARALAEADVSRASYVEAARARGWDPPSRFFRALRVLLAHQELRLGFTVRATSRTLGYSAPDALRRHFRRLLDLTPTEARSLATDDVTDHIERRA